MLGLLTLFAIISFCLTDIRLRLVKNKSMKKKKYLQNNTQSYRNRNNIFYIFINFRVTAFPKVNQILRILCSLMIHCPIFAFSRRILCDDYQIHFSNLECMAWFIMMWDIFENCTWYILLFQSNLLFHTVPFQSELFK